MEIVIDYENPSEVFLKGYKAYFYKNYLKGIVGNCILLLLSVLLIISGDLLILGYLISGYNFIYLLIVYLFYYKGPIYAISKRNNRHLTLSISSIGINTYSEVAELKYKWDLVDKFCLCKEYAIIILKDNRFVIFERKDISLEEYEFLINLVKGYKHIQTDVS